jgi:AraC-like DNA-binding protein
MREGRRVRLEEARRLVLDTDLATRHIARRVGFHDPAYLARLFRREFNIGISELRRESCLG